MTGSIAMKNTHVRTQATRIILACAVLLSAALTLAYGEDEVEVKGMIVGRTADTLTLRTPDHPSLVVLLTDDTKTQVPKGLFKARHEQMSMAELIPGLPVKVKGTNNPNGQLVASTIEFSSKDLKTANAIQAGLTPTQQAVESNKEAIGANQQNIAANKQQIGVAQGQITANQKQVEERFANLADYDVHTSTAVYFATGSSVLSNEAKAKLMQLAGSAANVKGYLIQVKGFCDSTGNAVQNQALSRDRAEAVVAYLMQSGKVPVRHILAPGAMGVVDPAASNESASGRAKNRRVEVSVLLNKGIAP
jgi:OmpA-OmpF porin, OOP family